MKRITKFIQDGDEKISSIREKRLLNELESIKLDLTKQMELIRVEKERLQNRIARWQPENGKSNTELKDYLQKYFNLRTRLEEKEKAVTEIDLLIEEFNEEIV